MHFRRAQRRRDAPSRGRAAKVRARQPRLMSAFSSYGPDTHARRMKDLLGNERKLRNLGAGRDLRRSARHPQPAARRRRPDTARLGDETTSFWLNRILLQIAATFESLVADQAARSSRARHAYERTMSTYNTPPQRAFARMLLRVVPDRDGLVACYGSGGPDELEPVCAGSRRRARVRVHLALLRHAPRAQNAAPATSGSPRLGTVALGYGSLIKASVFGVRRPLSQPAAVRGLPLVPVPMELDLHPRISFLYFLRPGPPTRRLRGHIRSTWANLLKPCLGLVPHMFNG